MHDLLFIGYKPSNAFDNNQDTLWISNGGAPPGMQWIAYEFDRPVFIGEFLFTYLSIYFYFLLISRYLI